MPAVTTACPRATTVLTTRNVMTYPSVTGGPSAQDLPATEGGTDGRSASFSPNGGLAASTSYVVQVFGVTDLAGQDINFFQSSFTTAQ